MKYLAALLLIPLSACLLLVANRLSPQPATGLADSIIGRVIPDLTLHPLDGGSEWGADCVLRDELGEGGNV
jgi:hypothetical protein